MENIDTAPKPGAEATARAGTALLDALAERVKNGQGRTVIADDLPELVALLELQNHEDSHIKRAIGSLHVGGAIQCGHPGRDEFKNHPNGRRGYKITVLIKP